MRWLDIGGSFSGSVCDRQAPSVVSATARSMVWLVIREPVCCDAEKTLLTEEVSVGSLMSVTRGGRRYHPRVRTEWWSFRRRALASM